MAENNDQPWHYLDANRNSQGPFPVSYLQELSKAKYFHDDTLFWREGQGEWKKLAQLPDLAASLASAAQEPSKPAVAAAVIVAPAATASAPESDPLAGFLSEIKTLEEQQGDEGDVPESPPPKERKFVDDDGTAYEWNSKERKFVPVSTQEETQYTADDMVYVPDNVTVPKYEPPVENEEEEEEEDEGEEGQADDGNGDQSKTNKRSARDASLEAAKEHAKRAKANREAQQGWFELKKNTSVYVTGLPSDATVAEVAEVFTKCGIIKEDVETRQPRIKLYKDKTTGILKGDALVTYLKEPSVDLAVNVLDGSPFRYGLPPMSVSVAKFEQKGDKYIEKASALNKKKKKKVLEAQEKRALGWTGFDDKLKASDVIVILHGMFTPAELANGGAELKKELEDDIKKECEKAGEVLKVKVFEKNPAGVVSVKFKAKEAAQLCVDMMQGRWFAGRQIVAEKYDGVTNYNVKAVEPEEDEQARLERFAAELEAAGDGGVQQN